MYRAWTGTEGVAVFPVTIDHYADALCVKKLYSQHFTNGACIYPNGLAMEIDCQSNSPASNWDYILSTDLGKTKCVADPNHIPFIGQYSGQADLCTQVAGSYIIVRCSSGESRKFSYGTTASPMFPKSSSGAKANPFLQSAYKSSDCSGESIKNAGYANVCYQLDDKTSSIQSYAVKCSSSGGWAAYYFESTDCRGNWRVLFSGANKGSCGSNQIYFAPEFPVHSFHVDCHPTQSQLAGVTFVPGT